jgi:hypothetical protein
MDYFRALNDKAARTVNFQILREGTQISIGLDR